MESKKARGNGAKWILLIVIIILGAITNPDEEEFKDYLSQQLSEEVDEDNWITTLLGDSVIDFLVESSLTKKDYVIFTTYEIEFDDEDSTYIGLFNNFIKLK